MQTRMPDLSQPAVVDCCHKVLQVVGAAWRLSGILSECIMHLATLVVLHMSMECKHLFVWSEPHLQKVCACPLLMKYITELCHARAPTATSGVILARSMDLNTSCMPSGFQKIEGVILESTDYG